MDLFGDARWQQFVELVDGVLGDAFADVSQVGFGVDSVELGGDDQAVDVGGAFAAGIGAGEEIVLAIMRRFS